MDPSMANTARSGIGSRLPILAPEDDEQLLRDAGFSGINLFYMGFVFRGWVAYA
jgi:tRNA (cmo5U34)-methyltransferase